jgi:hypothetical protein
MSEHEVSLDLATTHVVEAVKQRDRQTARRLVTSVSVLVCVVILSIVGQTLYIVENQRNVAALTRAQTVTAARLAAAQAISAAKIVASQARQQRDLLCSIETNAELSLLGLRTLAKRFGATIPPLPGEQVTTCHLGNDPVFIGTGHADQIFGTANPDWMNGEGGNDTLSAKGAGDTLIGDTGNDTLYGGDGSDYLYGGDGNDELHAADSDGEVDHLNGGPGNDHCYARRKDVVTSCEKVTRL